MAEYFEGTIVFNNAFDVEKAALTLKKAMRGLGTDDKKITEVMIEADAQQRQLLKKQYQTMYGRDLVEDLKSELGGYFETVVLSLLYTKKEYDVQCLREALKGAGSDEMALIDILCTSNNSEIADMLHSYKQRFDEDLIDNVKDDTTGDFQRILLSMLAANRDEGVEVDQKIVEQDAQALYDAGEGLRFSTDESEFNRVLASRSYVHLKAVFSKYHDIANEDLTSAIKSETSGDLQASYLAIVQEISNRPLYFAERIFETMKGYGTKDQALIRLIVSHCETDLVQIKDAFLLKFKISMEARIAEDCSGAYKMILQRLVTGNTKK